MNSAISDNDVFGPLPPSLASRRAPTVDRLPAFVRAWVIAGLSIALWLLIVEGLAWLAG